MGEYCHQTYHFDLGTLLFLVYFDLMVHILCLQTSLYAEFTGELISLKQELMAGLRALATSRSRYTAAISPRPVEMQLSDADAGVTV